MHVLLQETIHLWRITIVKFYHVPEVDMILRIIQVARDAIYKPNSLSQRLHSFSRRARLVSITA